MSKEEMLLVKGGGISSTMLNAIARLATTIYNVGRAFGSSLRRLFTRSTCKAS